ncbi:MAG TPA: hypothetical protein VK527_05210, partial [Candidatus Limnocylindrales bacterium]|nr:hypothetical protein [Candidatus Limnocylindrales bacterium]
MSYRVFAAGALLYVIVILVTSWSPGPGTWGVHLVGFLGTPAKLLVLSLLFIGVAASAAAAFGPAVWLIPPAEKPPEPRPRAPVISAATTCALLAIFAGTLWMLRTRTHFLGDGMIWLYGLREGDLAAPTEPLAQAIWQAASGALRHVGAPVLSSTLAVVSIACGVVAG